MKTIKHPGFFLAVLFSLATIATVALVSVAHANPLFFPVPTVSATATSSVLYLGTNGQATSTPVDSYTTTVQGFDKLALLVQHTASTSASVINVRYQYAIQLGSTSCVTTPSACDWYDDNYTSISTTTPLVSISQAVSFQSTATLSSTTNKILNVQTPTRYVRAIFTESVGPGALWYAWQPMRQAQ